MVSAGAYGRKAAAFTPRPAWVTAGLHFGRSEEQADVERDGLIMETWVGTVGDDDMVWILGGLGDPEYLDGLPGRKYLLGGPGDPFSVAELPPELAPRKLARSDGDEDKGKRPGMALIYPTERRRAEIVADYQVRSGGLAWVWTGWGAAFDPYKSLVKPRVLDRIIVRGRALAPDGTVDGHSARFDVDEPRIYDLEAL